MKKNIYISIIILALIASYFLYFKGYIDIMGLNGMNFYSQNIEESKAKGLFVKEFLFDWTPLHSDLQDINFVEIWMEHGSKYTKDPKALKIFNMSNHLNITYKDNDINFIKYFGVNSVNGVNRFTFFDINKTIRFSKEYKEISGRLKGKYVFVDQSNDSIFIDFYHFNDEINEDIPKKDTLVGRLILTPKR